MTHVGQVFKSNYYLSVSVCHACTVYHWLNVRLNCGCIWFVLTYIKGLPAVEHILDLHRLCWHFWVWGSGRVHRKPCADLKIKIKDNNNAHTPEMTSQGRKRKRSTTQKQNENRIWIWRYMHYLQSVPSENLHDRARNVYIDWNFKCSAPTILLSCLKSSMQCFK